MVGLVSKTELTGGALVLVCRTPVKVLTDTNTRLVYMAGPKLYMPCVYKVCQRLKYKVV